MKNYTTREFAFPQQEEQSFPRDCWPPLNCHRHTHKMQVIFEKPPFQILTVDYHYRVKTYCDLTFVPFHLRFLESNLLLLCCFVAT